MSYFEIQETLRPDVGDENSVKENTSYGRERASFPTETDTNCSSYGSGYFKSLSSYSFPIIITTNYSSGFATTFEVLDLVFTFSSDFFRLANPPQRRNPLLAFLPCANPPQRRARPFALSFLFTSVSLSELSSSVESVLLVLDGLSEVLVAVVAATGNARWRGAPRTPPDAAVASTAARIAKSARCSLMEGIGVWRGKSDICDHDSTMSKRGPWFRLREI